MKSLLYILEHLNRNELIMSLDNLDKMIIGVEKSAKLDSILKNGEEYWIELDKSKLGMPFDDFTDIIRSYGAFKIRSINSRNLKLILSKSIIPAVIALCYYLDYELNDKNASQDIAFIYSKWHPRRRQLNIGKVEDDDDEWLK